MQKLKEGQLSITPSMAAELVKAPYIYARQRPPVPDKVEEIAFTIREGDFIPKTTLDFVSYPDDRVELVNGQHRLRGVIAAKKPQLFVINLHPVKNEDEAHGLYRLFDTLGKPRSQKDAVKASELNKELGMELAPCLRFMASAALVEQRFDVNKLDLPAVSLYAYPPVREKISRLWKDHGRTFLGLAENMHDKRWRSVMMRAPIMGSFLLILSSNKPGKAKDFTRRVLHNDPDGQGDPAGIFVTTIYSALIKKSQTGSGSGVQKNLMQIAAMAWNADHAGERIKSLPLDSKKREIKFAGVEATATLKPLKEEPAPRLKKAKKSRKR